ncbi:MAG TPA: hypothetical protein PLO93_04085 [Candidatus Omnitrophota bacterium]|nr:hypothetical protein [Candidatus Omnitrophota bacterium]HQL41456.1 hypothetical protein [Candidatus Omnitrophota bacterium]
MARERKKHFFGQAAQATLEFAFAFIILVLIFYSVVRAMQWLGIVMLSPVQQHYQGIYSYQYTNSANSSSASALHQLSHGDKKYPQLKLVFPGQLLGN